MTPPRFMTFYAPKFQDFSRRTMQDEIDDLKRARAFRVFLILVLVLWAIVSTCQLIRARHELRVQHEQCVDAMLYGGVRP